MSKHYFFLPVCLTIVFAGCSATTGITPPPKYDEMQLGRAGLIRGEPEVALKYFNSAVAANRDYVNDFQEGPLTYRGRAQYELGKLPDARQDLTQALSRKDKDFMARLY